MNNYQELIDTLINRRDQLTRDIDRLNNERDQYALLSVQGDEKATAEIERIDGEVIPMEKERRTTVAAIAQAQQALEDEKKAAELQAKRNYLDQFEAFRDETLEQAAKVAQLMKAVQQPMRELESMVKRLHGYQFQAGTPVLNLRADHNAQFGRALLRGMGIENLLNAGPMKQSFDKYSQPEVYFNATLTHAIDRTGEALAAKAEAPYTAKQIPVNGVIDTEPTIKRTARPKKEIKVVAVKGGIDVIEIATGETLAELNDDADAFDSWFTDGYKSIYTLIGPSVPEKPEPKPKAPKTETKRYAPKHVGKGYWTIIDNETGESVLPENVQGKDMLKMVASQMGLDVEL